MTDFPIYIYIFFLFFFFFLPGALGGSVLICVLSFGYGLCHSFQLPVEKKALNSIFFFLLFSNHPVAWHLIASPFKAERRRAYGSICRMAEN